MIWMIRSRWAALQASVRYAACLHAGKDRAVSCTVRGTGCGIADRPSGFRHQWWQSVSQVFFPAGCLGSAGVSSQYHHR
jgi:hypothetical protein